MSDSISLEVKGIEELHNKTKEISEKISDSGQLVENAAYVIENQVKLNATKRPGPRVRTDILRSSIMTQIIGPTSARVAPNANYAPFVEFGHRQQSGRYVKAIRRRLVSDFSPAYPFMQPAIEQTKDDIQGVCVSFGNDLEDNWNK